MNYGAEYEKYDKIKRCIGKEELLAQLAEECAEMSKAALKLRRAMSGINPTPKTVDECISDLTEAFADVQICVDILNCIDITKANEIKGKKLNRWIERLGL